MSADFAFGVLAFTSLIIVYNPLQAVPIFLALTEGDSHGERKRVAMRAVFASIAALLVFALIGRQIMDGLRVTPPAFNIAAGILIFVIGSDMLQARRSRVKTTRREQERALVREDVSIIPLGLPTLAGPGSIVTGITISGQAENSLQHILVFVAILLVGVVTLPLLYVAPRLIDIFGRTGINVVNRIMGLLIMVVGVQLILDGVGEAVLEWGLDG